jgi:hypothetical protein
MGRTFTQKGRGLCLWTFLMLNLGITGLHADPRWGEFGGNFASLRRCYTGPRAGIDNNCYIDMIDGSIRHFATAHGLANKHALFVVSHGKAIETDFGRRYAFYPANSFAGGAQYSAGDLARVLGPAQAREIRILILAGCNYENMFSAKEMKRYFPNTTMIIHATPQTDASLISFLKMLTRPSAELSVIHNPQALAAQHFGDLFSPRRGGYTAEFYIPGERKPYHTQSAGRELLENYPSQ